MRDQDVFSPYCPSSQKTKEAVAVPKPEDVPAHSAAITRLRITADDSYLFSCGEDGCIFMFELKKKEIGSLQLGGSSIAKETTVEKKKPGAVSNATLMPPTVTTLPFADEILVTRTFLDEKQAQLVELERQVGKCDVFGAL